MIQYRNAVLNDIREVAIVHISTQPEYFTSTLGEDLLTKFYIEFLKEDNLFVVAVDDEKDKIVGFCMGNYYVSKAEKKWEHKYKSEIIMRLFLKCFQLNKLALSRAFGRLNGLVTGKKTIRDDYFCHLLSLGVLKEYRGNHIASNLIDEFEVVCINNQPESLLSKKKICTIGAYKWNTAGCKLYENKGYTVFEETKDKLKFMKELKPII